MDSIVRRRPTADPLYPDSRILRCAFAGHRPQKMPFGFDELDSRCIDFKKRLHDTIESLIWCGYSHFLSGGALGMDMYAAEIVLELRHDYPWIALEMVIPFDSQSDKWNDLYRTRYWALLDEADIVTFTSHEYMSIVRELGIPYGEDKWCHIDQFSAGGMSSGCVHGMFVEEAHKLLLSRLEKYV